MTRVAAPSSDFVTPPASPSANGPLRAAAVAHGGVGSPSEASDGCRAAVDGALAELARTGDPVAAAVAGIVVLEDDPRFSAGTGSVVRLDGSIQMDASIMSSDGSFGAVAALEGVRNPIHVAAAVRETPHLLLAGDGATQFARRLGHLPYDPTTPERAAATAALKDRLARRDPSLAAFWRGDEWRERWNYRLTPEELGITAAERGNDTVGLVIRTTDGRFVAALSTGGTAVMLRGRVGDVPLYGAGLWASNSGAAAATGTGERITEVLLANTVCGWLRDGAASDPDPATAADRAARRGVDLIAQKAETGLIVITPHSLGAYASAPMAWAGRHADEGWDTGRDGTRPGDNG